MPTAKPKRRIRRRAVKPGVVTPAKKMQEMQDTARDTEALMAQVMELQEKIAANEKALFATMQQYHVEVVEGTYGTYEQHTPKGRSTTEISTQGLYQRMDLDDFLGVVKPLTTEVKKHFSEKELADFSTTTPGKPGAPTLKYKPKKGK